MDWSFYALILVFQVIWYFLFGSWFKSQLKSLVSAVKELLRGLVPISRKKKRCSHCKRCARAKAKDRDRRWRHRALPVTLVVRCWRRSSIAGSPLHFFWNLNNLHKLFKDKAPRLVSDISQPVHWKWKKKKIKLELDQVALLRGTFEMHQSASDRLDPKTLILIWDTGASAGLTPFWSDFIDYVECKIDVHDITRVNKVVGIGTTLHKFVDNNGNHVYLPCVSYHLPMTDVRLFSPQIYHQLHDGYSVVNSNEVVMKFC